ncbi:rod shape-determining protein MreC [Alteromonas sp. 5E99-2]|uniref:rod shape-determining protein MreC n=1 Tax=Alteromonas sp. 5E99-2 TaxID=2817683 RepID=UPI001A98B419|nr:rod shape-determining protein MreC [Alteromonas sp. 5E99-2]MBO1255835.1 rod shape-determining protein MreC [Alteromonas sp. 5E99-2]
MDTIFSRGPSLATRLTMAVILSCTLIFVDHKLDGFQSTRLYLNSALSPLQYIANLPSLILNLSAKKLTSHQDLVAENQRLTDQLFIAGEKLQRFAVLEQENKDLRALLDAPIAADYKKIIAELMSVDRNPFSRQIMINKGTLSGIYRSQALVDEFGVIGQVMEVGTTNSRVLLLTDVTHSIPVRSLRNNIRFIASGSGGINELFLEHVTHSSDVAVGDVLVSSGLGGVFPAGYPVAKVTKVDKDERQEFATVLAMPLAALDRIKYVLLLEHETSFQNEEVQ